MLPCIRRQKVVTKTNGKKVTTFRCINKESPANGQEVTENICENCLVRKFQRPKPGCQQKEIAKPSPSPAQNKKVGDEVKELVHGTPLEDLPLEGVDMNVSEDDPQYPAFSMQLWLYKDALSKWKKAGYPVRTDAQVKEIHENKCKPCNWYDSEKKRCKGCGCKVTIGSVAVFNKIKMATEHCPKGEW